jgi:hypothetical protein
LTNLPGCLLIELTKTILYTISLDYIDLLRVGVPGEWPSV